MKSLFLFAFASALAGCAMGVDRDAQLDDIREAAFRYQSDKNAGLRQHAKVFFLAVIKPGKKQQADPTDEFMARFAGNQPRVAKLSAASFLGPTGVQDKETGERGVILQLGDIRWISDDSVEVDGAYYEASEGAAGSIYYLMKQKGKWVVERAVMQWIT